jgi:hypothetical protein
MRSRSLKTAIGHQVGLRRKPVKCLRRSSDSQGAIHLPSQDGCFQMSILFPVVADHSIGWIAIKFK